MAESSGIALYNFEDNDLSAWTITEEGTCDMSVSSSAAAHGSYGCRFSFDGTNNECHGYRTFTAGSDIYARCYFYIPSGFGMNTSYLDLLSLRNSAEYLAYMRFTFSGSTLSTGRLYYRTNSGVAYVSYTTAITRDSWHYLELRYKSDLSAGMASCYLDDTKIAEATGLATNNYQASVVRVGNSPAGVPTSGSYFDIDDVKINSSYIGEYTESGGSSIPTIINNYRQQGVM